jgi:hypothetical protein
MYGGSGRRLTRFEQRWVGAVMRDHRSSGVFSADELEEIRCRLVDEIAFRFNAEVAEVAEA